MFGLETIFLNQAGLVTALVLLPFFIIYLIRPKPRHETVPSLLFIMKDMGKNNIDSFFRTFFKDFLFLIQLLLLLLLITAAAKPFLNVPKSYLVEQTVLIVDASASMNADNRFKQAVEIADEALGKQNTIITVTSAPEVLVERVGEGEARQALKRLKAADTTTALSDALQLATGYATTGTRVVVVSDFLPSAGDLDYETAADVLEGTGALIEYRPVTGGTRNVGIIDLQPGPVTSSVWVKNYDARPADVTLRISDAKQQLLLAPGETKEVTFKTPAGVAELKLEPDDDLLVDNAAWVSAPEKTTIKMLVITNEKARVERSNFLLALNVISKNFPTTFDIRYAVPPQIPALDHDVYVIDQASLQFILPGYIRDLQKKTAEGAAVIVFQQEGLFAIDWQGLLPVSPANDTNGLRTQLLPSSMKTLTNDIEFGQVGSYLRVVATPDASVLAATATADPIIVTRRIEKGHVLYYGLDDTKASFSKDPSYPVFWRRTFDLLTNRPSLENLNVRTGNVLTLPRAVKIKTPDGSKTASILPLDKAGLYTLPDRTIAVNLLSDRESNILTTENVTASRAATGEKTSEKAPKDLTDWALWAAIAVLLFEILYVKYRGDF